MQPSKYATGSDHRADQARGSDYFVNHLHSTLISSASVIEVKGFGLSFKKLDSEDT